MCGFLIVIFKFIKSINCASLESLFIFNNSKKKKDFESKWKSSGPGQLLNSWCIMHIKCSNAITASRFPQANWSVFTYQPSCYCHRITSTCPCCLPKAMIKCHDENYQHPFHPYLMSECLPPSAHNRRKL